MLSANEPQQNPFDQSYFALEGLMIINTALKVVLASLPVK